MFRIAGAGADAVGENIIAEPDDIGENSVGAGDVGENSAEAGDVGENIAEAGTGADASGHAGAGAEAHESRLGKKAPRGGAVGGLQRISTAAAAPARARSPPTPTKCCRDVDEEARRGLVVRGRVVALVVARAVARAVDRVLAPPFGAVFELVGLLKPRRRRAA